METANETAARIKSAIASSTGAPASTPTTPSYNNALLQVLTERLTKQGQGVSTSASSNIQTTIDQSIADITNAGEANRQRLLSERGRELGFAQDRAAATFTTALEGRTGYATMVAGLKELTETTEKSVRDLDSRYQEALLANDSETAKSVAELRTKKLEFQLQQEQNFYTNLFSLASLQQQAIGQQMQGDQFWAEQTRMTNEFNAKMMQSNDQFEKTYGIQIAELGLKSQELDLARERNQISWAEYRLQKQKLEDEKGMNSLGLAIYGKMKEQVTKQGVPATKLDPLAIATEMVSTYAAGGINLNFEDVIKYATQSQEALVNSGVVAFQELPDEFKFVPPVNDFRTNALEAARSASSSFKPSMTQNPDGSPTLYSLILQQLNK